MHPFTVALLQMTAGGSDLAAHQTKGEDFCRRASRMRADLALFPEMWSAGYTPAGTWDPQWELWRDPALWPQQEATRPTPSETDLWQGLAIARDHSFLRHFQALARELNMAIAITYLEDWPRAPRNSVSVIDRHGEIVLTYAKVHTCDWSMDEAALQPGTTFPVCCLDSAGGPVHVGAMICYDREFPESARLLMLGGAELILCPNSCELETHRLSQFQTRATENMVGVAMANYAGARMGHSVAYDPVAFDARGSRNTLVIEAGEAEGVYLAHFDLSQIREYRRRETWGNAFRRPHRYQGLTERSVAAPFVRVDRTGRRYDEMER